MENKYLILIEKLIKKTKEDNTFIWEICHDNKLIDIIKRYTALKNIIKIYQKSIILISEKTYHPFDFFIIKQNLEDPFNCISKKNTQSYPYIMIGIANNSPPLIITINLLNFSSILQELYELIQKKVNDSNNQLDLFTQILDTDEFYASAGNNIDSKTTKNNYIISLINKKSSSEYLNKDDIIYTGRSNNNK